MSVTIMAALPAAQNAYIAATRAKAGERIAQGTVLVTTFASLPVVIAIAAFFPITLNTLGGFQSLPSGYLEVARLYRLGVSETFRKVYLPNALPQILVGLKLGLGSSWMAVVAAELIAANSGIGYRLSYSRGLLRSDAVILCMLVIGLVGILMDKLLTALFRRLLPWQKKA